jgi:hypothetical protein
VGVDIATNWTEVVQVGILAVRLSGFNREIDQRHTVSRKGSCWLKRAEQDSERGVFMELRMIKQMGLRTERW